MQYNNQYYKMMIKNNSATAEFINKKRWDYIKELNPQIVLDYGSGCNFLTKFAPKNIIVDSFDIGHLNGKLYPQTGILHDYYDLIFFNDVIEHVDWKNNPDNNIEKIFQKTNYIFISIPICSDIKNLKNWKHYKPGEHLTYFTKKSIEDFLNTRNFTIVKKSSVECPPRKDIFSFVYKKEKK